jgi:hypothetical protein
MMLVSDKNSIVSVSQNRVTSGGGASASGRCRSYGEGLADANARSSTVIIDLLYARQGSDPVYEKRLVGS